MTARRSEWASGAWLLEKHSAHGGDNLPIGCPRYGWNEANKLTPEQGVAIASPSPEQPHDVTALQRKPGCGR